MACPSGIRPPAPDSPQDSPRPTTIPPPGHCANCDAPGTAEPAASYHTCSSATAGHWRCWRSLLSPDRQVSLVALGVGEGPPLGCVSVADDCAPGRQRRRDTPASGSATSPPT